LQAQSFFIPDYLPLQRFLNNLDKFSSKVRNRYTRDLEHYSETALILRDRFKDQQLTIAGFMHGVPSLELQEFFQGELDREVLKILKEREKLRSLDANDPDVQQQLVANVLPSINEARSVILFVVEKLHEFDITGAMSRWTSTFHLSPSQLPSDIMREIKFDLNQDNLFNLRGFSKHVLATTAEYFGMWHERNVFRNAGFIMTDPERFEDIVDFVLEYQARSKPLFQKLFNTVLKPLKSPNEKELFNDIRWEWHHVASIDTVLSGIKMSEWDKHIQKCGMVTILISGDKQCYEVLFNLHAHFDYHPKKLKDFIGNGTPGGYKAIHTMLVPPEELQKDLKAIFVRLVPKRNDTSRYRIANLNSLSKIKTMVSNAERFNLHVFAPDGLQVTLPRGATVLDFAFNINRKFVAHIKSAMVNRQNVKSLLKPLQNGDIVRLTLDRKMPQEWPIDVLNKVFALKSKKIKLESEKRLLRMHQQFKKSFKPRLVFLGRQWLKEELRHSGILESISDDLLDSFFQQTLVDINKKYPRYRDHKDSPATKDVWYKHLGIWKLVVSNTNLGYRVKVNEYIAQDVLEAVMKVIKKTKLDLYYDIRVPEDLQKKINGMKLCKLCNPDVHSSLIGTEAKGLLWLHRIGSKCSENGFEVTVKVHSFPPQYFYISSSNHTGVASEVLNTFKNRDVEIADLVGKTFGHGWVLFRIKINYINSDLVELVYSDLIRLQGVHKVWRPGDPVDSGTESLLPPKELDNKGHLIKSSPYVCGTSIYDDYYFYGRRKELLSLNSLFTAANRKSIPKGVSAFIYGPKRIGKSSLALHFLRKVKKEYPSKCIPIYYESSVGDSWSKVATELKRRLIRSAETISSIRGKSLPDYEEYSLLETIKLFKSTFDCSVMIILDEVIGIFQESANDVEKEKLLKFFSGFLTESRSFLMMVGPQGPAKYITEEYQRILENAEAIHVEKMTYVAIRALIRAEQLSQYYNIWLSRPLVEKIYKYTSGNPYWVSHLGRYMWDQVNQTNHDAIRYNNKMLTNAILEIFKLGITFSDRLDRIQNFESFGEKVLTILAREKQFGSITSKVLNAEEILDQLEKDFTVSSLSELLLLLEKLKAQGAVAYSPTSSKGWKIQAPILADYIVHRERLGR